MDTIFLSAVLIISLVYEYFKREKAHKLTIENLKDGILPTPIGSQKDLAGIILLCVVGIVYFAFLLYLIFYLPIKIQPLLLIAPIGIGVSLALLLRRDINIYNDARKGEGQ